MPLNRLSERAPSVGFPWKEGWKHSADADVAYFTYAPLIWRFFGVACPKIAGLHSFLVDPGGSSSNLDSMSTWEKIRYLGPRFTIADRYFRLSKTTELSVFDAIHTVSGLAKYSHPNVFHISLFVDRSVYRPVSMKRSKFTVLFVGRDAWTKGLSTFIDMSRILSSDHFDFESAGVCTKTNSVRDLGFLVGENLVRAYSEAHCLVHPTRADVFPTSILESLACGTPVITTPLESHRGHHLPVGYAQTANQMAEELRKLQQLWEEHPDEYTRLSESARIATAAYDIKIVGPMYEDMLKRVHTGRALTRRR